MVTFPIDFPSTPGFVQSTLIPVMTNKGTRSPLSAKQKILSFDGDHWDLSFTLPLMSRTQAAPWHAKLASLRGNFGTFKWYDRYQTDIQGSNAGGALIKGASQVGSELLVDGLTLSAVGVFKAGDKIQVPVTTFSDELKTVLEDVDADGAGEATIPIWPPIINPPADNGAIVTASAYGVFRLLSPSAFPVSGIGNYEITVNATEAI
ncbi:MAG: hypothetical protein KAJ19_27675 [Gammaproteobacteria bacterium]|nr:hypothetical protein [Gammaproteobacteria bacterium]